MISGSPGFDNRVWLRAVAIFQRLPELLKRLVCLRKISAKQTGDHLPEATCAAEPNLLSPRPRNDCRWNALAAPRIYSAAPSLLRGASRWRKGGTSNANPSIAIVLLAVLLLSACHSYHIDATIENRTGADIQLLEVPNYPSASFGADSALRVRGDLKATSSLFKSPRQRTNQNSPTRVSDQKQIQIAGPTLAERQQGQLKIVLLPAGKAQFQPQLTPPS